MAPLSSFHYRKTWEAMAHADRILIVIPPKTDGDNIGSSLALFLALRALGKHVAIVSIAPLPPVWRFLPAFADVVATAAIVDRAWDVMVVTDVSDADYAGITPLRNALSPRPILVQIDHHATNTFFGDVNCVDAHAASATTVVTHLLRDARVSIDADSATCLLTGLLTDTGFFSNPATNEQALETGAFLLDRGARFTPLLRLLLKNKDVATLKLWGKALERLRLHKERGLAVTVLFYDELQGAGLTSESAEGITNFLHILGGVRAVCILREEEPGMLRGSLRTTHPTIDISRLAMFFGGGGHKKAAGFGMAGKLVERGGRWEVEV